MRGQQCKIIYDGSAYVNTLWMKHGNRKDRIHGIKSVSSKYDIDGGRERGHTRYGWLGSRAATVRRSEDDWDCTLRLYDCVVHKN